MIDDQQLARSRAHSSNIQRYRNLLQTNLTELERQFVERRLTEEQSNGELGYASSEIRSVNLISRNFGIVSALQPVRRPAMTKDFVVICAGMLAVSAGVWNFWGCPQDTKPTRTEVVRILADGPALKLASETSPYMRTER